MVKRQSIAQVAAVSGFSAPTLRFYEQEGIIPPVPRDAAGNRVYGEPEMARINTIRCLRAAGLSLPQMKRYFSTPSEGEECLRIRKEILLSTQELLKAQRDEMQRCMRYLEHKIHFYDLSLAALAQGDAPPVYRVGEFNCLFEENQQIPQS